MANVMDGIAFDSYCIHYDTSIMTMKETLHLLNAVSIGTSGRDLRTLETNKATASGS
jgi:hypothetical protein